MGLEAMGLCCSERLSQLQRQLGSSPTLPSQLSGLCRNLSSCCSGLLLHFGGVLNPQSYLPKTLASLPLSYWHLSVTSPTGPNF